MIVRISRFMKRRHFPHTTAVAQTCGEVVGGVRADVWRRRVDTNRERTRREKRSGVERRDEMGEERS